MVHVDPIEVQKYLEGVDYPASKQTLIDKARRMGADANVCASLEQLPDEDFQTPADVSQALGEAQGRRARRASKGPQVRKDGIQ